MEDTKQKIHVKKNLQMTGFAMILQVWFYEGTNYYTHADEKYEPWITSWVNLYIGRKYDATVLISSMKDNQVHCSVSLSMVIYVLYSVLVVMVVFDCADGPFPGSSGGRVHNGIVHCYTAMKKKLEYMTAYTMARGEAIRVHKGLVLSLTWEGSGDAHEIDGRALECDDQSNDCCVLGQGGLGPSAGTEGCESPC
ncbi:hypothetical protein Cgig2_021771 [Carnegiea gigantea]|uniref:Uncharacterized protein n=1 Tax=Carnegiea gigantea TaxID=171969 RepID=A0A9Q1GIE8_9CARY|nr:hypothetical protein Cgig2_021771 [Carnegiea gigantea]